MTALSVNVNKIAWLRNARDGSRPDLCDMTRLIISAGANGITIHPRPDQRHIRSQDVFDLSAVVSAVDGVEFNVEGNPTAGPTGDGYPGFPQLIEAVKPDQCTLVPDAEHQLTSDHGWDLSEATAFDRVSSAISMSHDLGVRVSLFIDPIPDQISRVIHAKEQDLGINAGHDLNLYNLTRFCSIGSIDEVSIGHALIADALELGLKVTMQRYLDALSTATLLGR